MEEFAPPKNKGMYQIFLDRRNGGRVSLLQWEKGDHGVVDEVSMVACHTLNDRQNIWTIY